MQKRWRLRTPVWMDRGITALGIWIAGSILQAIGHILRWRRWSSRPQRPQTSSVVAQALRSFPSGTLGWDALLGRLGIAIRQPSEGIWMEWGTTLRGGYIMKKEERRRILEMVAQGKISPEEGLKLLEALENQSRTSHSVSQRKGKTLLIEVHDLEEDEHVVVRIPLSLVRWGLQAGLSFKALATKQIQDPELRKQIEHAFDALSNLDFDRLVEEAQEMGELVRVDSDEDKVIIRIE